MTQERSIILRSDEGAILIWGPHGAASLVAEPWDGNTLVRIPIDLAGEGGVFIETGDQAGPLLVTTRQLDLEPPVDDEWDDVVEFSVSTTGSLEISEVIDRYPSLTLVGAAGEYRIRVSARARGRNHKSLTFADPKSRDEESEDPVEWYLVEAWPAAGSAPAVVRLASQFAIAGLAGPPKPVIPEARAGVAAAVRIGRDLDGGLGARTLSGAVAKVTVNGKIPGNRRKLFPEFAHLISWTDRWDSGPGWSFASLPSREYEPGIFHYGFGGDAVDPITGSSGAIRTAFVEVKRPSYVLRSWNWVTRPAGPKTPREEWPAVLPRDTLLSVMLDESTDSDGRPWTTVRLEHDDLPVEWVDDMAAWWELQIALVGQTGPGVA